MVALNKFSLALVVALCGSLSVVAQQIQPRIEGLETDSRYMSLLLEDNKLTLREDSISVVVESLRMKYRSNPDGEQDSRDRIIQFENQLFELRARKATVVDSLNYIEQAWVVNNMGNPTTSEQSEQQQAMILAPTTNVKFIYESSNVKKNLSEIDYKNLIKSEELEVKANDLCRLYAVNYNNQLSLTRSYEFAITQSEALEIQNQFESLNIQNQQILEQLDNAWGFIYDNKSFAYGILMEILGFSDVLQEEAELMRKAQSEISAKQGGEDAMLRYLVQKGSMVEYESIVAQRLGLANVVDSLNLLSKKMASMDKVSPPKLELQERLFITYEPIEFVTKTIYSKTNPIPKTVIPERGVIFRIFVGSFQYQQQVSIFRNTIPLSYLINDQKRYCYYIGGFATLQEAEEAHALLKSRGFRSPQIVVWSDGKERNLTTDPLVIDTNVYRLEILDVRTLPDGASQKISSVAPNSSISKVGNDKFVIMSLESQAQADQLIKELQALDPQLKFVVGKSEVKIEF